MKDLFSGHSGEYASFRPTYPKDLYSFIFNHLRHFDVAWDAGTGNGQVAVDLSKKFGEVWATDISQQQLDHAKKEKNISYSVAGETTEFPEDSVDLITVGQAIHWFDREKFYREVKRVGKPESYLAVWGYGLLTINPKIDPHVQHFYREVISPYWDPERRLIDEHYKTIDFPFDEIKTPLFEISFEWSLDQFHGYLNTWSSVQKYIKANGINPTDDVIKKIGSLWGDALLKISFPLFLRLGKI